MIKRNSGILILDEFLAENTDQISQNSIDKYCFKEIYEIEEYILRKQQQTTYVYPETTFFEENIPKEKKQFKKPPKCLLKKKGSSYRPKHIRGEGPMREGLCEDCNEWFRLKTSSYWYHMNFKHGVASNGEKYPEPDVYFKSGRPVSICPLCDHEIYLGANIKILKYNWYKHFQKNHKKDYE
ncbi:hypothetical protein EDEG_00499 [Edhazardia aedis USNM 41457]|uniref:Transcription regulator Rua1 C-terminal domain-containing protein n=1 Tax=Edhazardia aedis (strain USNM 41457) TaxID=1003232 RepID=J9D156_EDHAE|nr:hypothetical protein EDEG_00499 [Edhazardia aedis USNM 41457]|eukprot:EJW01314.1 hypothetical protein EDEG_00499 [Edhazardia aedis USNM 41457]